MLLGLFPESVSLIQELKKTYRIALLSNINDIHYTSIEDECMPLFLELHDCFLSYKIGMRKPNYDIFLYALDRINIKPENALFIDDAYQNIIAARSLGIQTVHLASQTQLKEALHSLNISI